MKTYRSRISISLLVFCGIVCFGPMIFIHEMGGIIAATVVFLCIALALSSIKYVIDGQTLKVYPFWFVHQDIDITTITKMEPSRCPLSSPAASLKRLAVHYGKHDVVYISPRNQEDFIRTIDEIRRTR